MSDTLWLDSSVPSVNGEGLTILWNSSNICKPNISILDYIELHALSLRRKYLSFIYDLGQYEINNKRIVSHLSEKRGYNLWWMSQIAEKTHINSPYLTDCIKLFALEEIFLKNKIKSIEVYVDQSQKSLYKSVYFLCSNLGIACKYKLVGGLQHISYREFIHKLRPEWFSVLRYFLRYLVLHRKLFGKRPANWSDKSSSVTFFSYFTHLDAEKCNASEFYSKQWEYLPALLKKSGKNLNWLHHFLRSKEAKTVDKAVSWIDEFNSDSIQQGNHAFFENYLSLTSIFRVYINYCHFYLKSLTFRNIKSAFKPQNSALNLWPMFKEDWYLSLRGGVAIRNWLFIEMIDQVLQELPKQSLGLYVQENMYWERALLHGWSIYGHGEIVGVPLATVNFWDLRYCEDERATAEEQNMLSLPIPDKVALHGSLAKKHYISNKYPMDATVEVEALRYLYLETKSNKASSIKINQNNELKILVLGEFNGDTTMELLLATTSIDVSGFNVTFTLKPHPVCPMGFEKFDVINIPVTFEPIDKIVNDFDVAIVARTTSAAMDVYYSGLKVIVFLGKKEINLSPLRNVADVQFVRTATELSDVICNLNTNLLQDQPDNSYDEEYFYLDNNLSRWKSLISSVEEGIS